MQGLTVNGVVFTPARKEFIIALCTVVFVEPVELDQLYQLVSIARIGCIAGSFQAACPAFIVGWTQTEKTAVTLASGEKTRMVLIALIGVAVGTEALVAGVVVIIDGCAAPAVTLDSEVIVATTGQRTLSRT